MKIFMNTEKSEGDEILPWKVGKESFPSIAYCTVVKND